MFAAPLSFPMEHAIMQTQNVIVRKKELIPGQTTLLEVHTPHIAAKALPGNFIILRVSENGERIPLTIADADRERGTIAIVFLVLGKTTALLNELKEGDMILDVCGPLGRPTLIEKSGTVICVGGGTGIAAMHHIAKGHWRVGNRVVAIIGARNKDLLLFHDELSSFAHEILVSTNDGSFGHKGLVTELLRNRLDADPSVSEVVAVGPVPMMKAVSLVTKAFDIKTTVSLNAIMIDGIGMCGACRVTVNGETRFTCVDGPEFDGQAVDFDELNTRLATFKPMEKESMDVYCRCANHEKK